MGENQGGRAQPPSYPSEADNEEGIRRMSDLPPAYVRVSKNGTKTLYELMFRGEKLCDLTHAEVVEIALNIVSASRWK